MQGANLQKGSPNAPFMLKFRSSTKFIAFAVVTATFTDGFLYSIIVPVLPFSLLDRLGVDPSMLQFWITMLFIGFGSCMLLGAPISGMVARFSSLRQMPLLVALLFALASTLLFMFALKTWVLVVARCIQGLSAGVVYTTALSLLAETVRRDELGSWMGIALSGVNVGTLIAPALAGVVYDLAGYHPVFILCLAVVGFDFVLTLILIDKKKASKWLPALEARDHIPPSPSESEQNDSIQSESSPSPRGDVQNKPVSHDVNDVMKRSGSPQPDEESPLLGDHRVKPKTFSQRWFPITAALLTSPQIDAALYSCFINSLLIASFDAILPHFVQRTFHWNSTKAGLIFLTITIPSLLNPLFGTLSDRYGRRLIALIGFALATPAIALLGLVRYANITDTILACVLLVFVGTGMNCFLTPLVTDMTFAVEKVENDNPELFRDASAFTEAYAMVDATFGAGAVLGPLISGVVYEKANWSIAVGVLAALCFSAAVPTAIYTQGSDLSSENRDTENDV